MVSGLHKCKKEATLGGGSVFPGARAASLASKASLGYRGDSTSLSVSSSGQGSCPSILGQGWAAPATTSLASCDLLCPPQCRGDPTKTYSLEAYDNWFNCLSMLVATEVCRVSTAQRHRQGDGPLPNPAVLPETPSDAPAPQMVQL